MAVRRQNAEAFTTGNQIDTFTASPDAFTRYVKTGAGTCTVTSAAAIGGSKGFDSYGTSGDVAQAGWYNASDVFTNVAGSARFKGMSAPGADQRVLNAIATSGSASCPYFIWRTNGNIELWNAAHTLVPGWTATTAPTSPTDTMELRLYIIKGSTTSNGTIKAEMLINDISVQSANNTAANAGTVTYAGMWFGRPTTATWSGSVLWDDAAFDTAATDLILATGTSAGLDQTDIEPWATVTLSGIGTGTWTQSSGVPSVTLNGSGATVTFEAPPTRNSTTLTFDYGGDTMSVTMLPATTAIFDGGLNPVWVHSSIVT